MGEHGLPRHRRCRVGSVLGSVRHAQILRALRHSCASGNHCPGQSDGEYKTAFVLWVSSSGQGGVTLSYLTAHSAAGSDAVSDHSRWAHTACPMSCNTCIPPRHRRSQPDRHYDGCTSEQGCSPRPCVPSPRAPLILIRACVRAALDRHSPIHRHPTGSARGLLAVRRAARLHYLGA